VIGLAVPVLFLSGALALVYEVLWQRRFALMFGGGAPAAAAVLAAYFAGLGAGSHLVGRLAARGSRPLRLHALLQALVAMGALGSVPLASAAERLGLVAWSGTAGPIPPQNNRE
jgi:predicted membrane-bound spermidine synthase